MTPQELKNSILQLAIQGKLVEQRPEEGTAQELYAQIQAEKQRLIKEGKLKKEKLLPEITEDEKSFEIPESWKWVRLGSIISISSGDGLTSKEMDESGIYPVYGGNGINGHHNSYNVSKKTLVIGRVGFYCGSTHITDDKAWVTDNAFITTFDENRIDMKWLKFYIDYLNPRKKASSTAQPVISGKLIYPMLVPIPPLAEQKRIVAKIEELLPLVDRYEQAWTKLEDFNRRFPEDMKKSILQQAIQGKLVEQRPEEGTAQELYAQIQAEKQRLIKAGKLKKEKPLPEITEDEKPFEIPEGWMWVSVGSVCINIQYGSSQKSAKEGKVAVLRMGNIQNGKLVFDKLVYTSDESEIQKYPLKYNDLLFNRTNSKELVGKTAIYKGEIPAIYAGYLVRITPLYIDSDYLNYVMQSQFYWSYCQSVRSDAIGQSNINAEKLKRFVFPLPPLAEQKRIVARLEELLPMCEKLK